MKKIRRTPRKRRQWVLQKGRGAAWVIYVLVLMMFCGAFLVNGIMPRSRIFTDSTSQQFRVSTDLPRDTRDNLQLKTLKPLPCNEQVSVNFLIDNSGSMALRASQTKLPELQKALNTFAARYPDNGVIAMQTFSTSVREPVPVALYKDVKGQFQSAISNMNPDGYTYTRTAFNTVQQRLREAKSKFPNHKHTLIFISDGIPESAETNLAGPDAGNTCAPSELFSTWRCFDESQDPTPVANQIKQEGFRIFTIAFVDRSEQRLNEILQEMMRRVASPNDYYFAPFETELTGILSSITQQFCE